MNKLVVIDIETSPAEGYFWSKPWETSIIKITKQPTILCFAYQWLGEKTKVVAQPDFKKYKKGKLDDYEVVKALRDILDKADIVIGQNSDNFDLKWFNTRCITHKFPPPSPFKTVDTLKVSKRYFLWLTNKLDFVSQQLGHGGKVEHEGFPLWEKCMSGNKKAWEKMKKYNKHDVDITANLYEEYLAWITQKKVVFEGNKCPHCAGVPLKKGIRALADGTHYQSYQCRDCGKWFHGNKVIQKL